MNSPKFSVISLILKFGNKKDVGSLFLRAYPRTQAFALPFRKNKQRKPAHAEQYYIIMTHSIVMRRYGQDIIHPRRRFSCITSVRNF